MITRILLTALLGGLVVSAEAQLPRQAVVGSWIMEDVYTLQLDPTRGFAVESHQPGIYSYRVVLNADGTGVIDGEPFAWSLLDDEMLWRFRNGVTVSSLTRFLDPDRFLLLALATATAGPVGSISSLTRTGENSRQ